MDHVAFTKSLTSKDKTTIAKRNKWSGLVQLSVHLTVIILLGWLVTLGGVASALAILPLGISLVFLFTLEHEATHKTPFENNFLNESVGHFCAFVLILPFQWFRYFHLAHHKFTNDPNRDPELLAGAKPETTKAFIWHLSGFPYWIGMSRQLLRNASGVKPYGYVPKSAYGRIKTEARILISLYFVAGGLAYYYPIIFWLWVIPVMIGQPFLRLYLLAEHNGCAFVSNMFENTRTIYTNPIVRFLAWNMPYHVEHHTMPNVPFYNLPKLNASMEEHLKVTEQGYVNFGAKYIKQL